MVTIKEEAQNYESEQTKNIADLDKVSVDLNIEPELRKGTNNDGKEFKYKVTIVDGEEYRVPNSVLKNLKVILKAKPDLKTFKVVKTGEGMNTSYTVVPID